MDSSIPIQTKVIRVKDLRKSYKDVLAVDGISFDVSRGEIFGLLGPNGAGKTTIVECLQGLRNPSSGTIQVLDIDPSKNPGAFTAYRFTTARF